MTRAILTAAILIVGLLPALAQSDGAPPRQRNPVDRGDIVIRSPDNSDVPADLTPRQPRDIQINIDPYGRRYPDGPRPRPPRPYDGR